MTDKRLDIDDARARARSWLLAPNLRPEPAAAKAVVTCYPKLVRC